MKNIQKKTLNYKEETIHILIIIQLCKLTSRITRL